MAQTHNFIGLPLLDYFQNSKRHLMTLHDKRDTDCIRISFGKLYLIFFSF